MKTLLRIQIATAVVMALASCSLLEQDKQPHTAQVAPPKPAETPTNVIPIIQPGPDDITPTGPVVSLQTRPLPKPNLVDPKILVGLDQVTVEEMLGKPANIRDEPPATVWSYKSDSKDDSCTLDVFFFVDIEANKLRALSYDVQTNDFKTNDIKTASGKAPSTKPGQVKSVDGTAGSVNAADAKDGSANTATAKKAKLSEREGSVKLCVGRIQSESRAKQQ